MKAQISFLHSLPTVDFSHPINISLPIRRDDSNPNAYFLPKPVFEPFRTENFVGSVAEGGPVNCEVIQLAPHGNGTHTECVGHISKEPVTIAATLKQNMFHARLVSVQPSERNGDFLVSCESVDTALQDFQGEALLIRTLPNLSSKESCQWSGTNPIYCEKGVGNILRSHGIKHFCVDFPSVDREDDAGALQVHHEFWNYPENPRLDSTITEMIFVPYNVPDADYLLQICTIGLHSDASPSQLFLYELHQNA